MLLERDDELATIARAMESARGGAGRVLLVEGDAGAGKTALLGQAVAAAGGLRVLEARAGVLERSVGLGVARELLEATVLRAPAQERARLLQGPAAFTAPLLGVEPHRLTDPAQTRHGLYWLVANLAEQAPLAIVLDDAQWCDEASLDWLLYLARRLERLPVLVLVGVRAGEPDTPRARARRPARRAGLLPARRWPRWAPPRPRRCSSRPTADRSSARSPPPAIRGRAATRTSSRRSRPSSWRRESRRSRPAPSASASSPPAVSPPSR